MTAVPATPLASAALGQLAAEFPAIPPRILAAVLVGYIQRALSVPEAISASRARLVDACAA